MPTDRSDYPKKLNPLEPLLEGDQQQNPFLFVGYTIKIERAEETPSEAIKLAAANLSPQRIQVNVICEVNTPGRLELMANTPLVQAILQIVDPKVSEQQLAQDLGLASGAGEGSWHQETDVEHVATGADALLLLTAWQHFERYTQ